MSRRFNIQIESDVPNGTAPMIVDSSTLVTNFNADLLDGQHGSYYQNAGNLNAGTILAARMPALTGDITTTAGAISTTLANTAVTAGSYGSASAVATFTVDSKGRLTAASNTNIAIAQSAVTNLTTDLSAKANLASPTFTGIPSAPTAAVDTNTTQIATTAFVLAQASGSNPLALGSVTQGTSTRYARQDHVHPTTGLGLTSGTLAQFASTTSSQLAGVISDETGTGSLVFATSPTLTTPNIGVATGTSFNSITGLSSTTPVMDGTATVGTGTTVARADHVHPTDTTRAALASPTFTGTPAAPTAAVGTNTTQIATTAFVLGQASSSNPLALGSVAQGTSTRYARQDHVHPTTGLGLTSGTLAQFAATTSAQLAGVISDETGSGALVFGTAPNFTTDIEVNAGSLSGTAATVLTPLALNATTSNGDLLRFKLTRESTGADWTTAGWRMQRTVDVTDMGYIEFGSTSAQDVRIGSSNTDIAVFNTTGATFSGIIISPAATTAISSIRIPHGTAPTSPTNGDIWTTTTGLFARINGATQQYATLASPTFTGTPTAPTANAGTNTTQIATTAYVTTAVASAGGGSSIDPFFLGGM